MRRQARTKKVTLSQSAILNHLKPDDHWALRQIWQADCIQVCGKPVVSVRRDSWVPRNPSKVTRDNLKRLLETGQIEGDNLTGYYLPESTLESMGHSVLGSKITALESLLQRTIDHLNRSMTNLYEWNRVVYLGANVKVSHWCHDPNEFYFLQYHADIPYESPLDRDRTYTCRVMPQHPTGVIDDIARVDEWEAQTIEMEIARVCYEQDLAIARRRASRNLTQS